MRSLDLTRMDFGIDQVKLAFSADLYTVCRQRPTGFAGLPGLNWSGTSFARLEDAQQHAEESRQKGTSFIIWNRPSAILLANGSMWAIPGFFGLHYGSISGDENLKKDSIGEYIYLMSKKSIWICSQYEEETSFSPSRSTNVWISRSYSNRQSDLEWEKRQFLVDRKRLNFMEFRKFRNRMFVDIRKSQRI